MSDWYELRIAGSPGTATGNGGITEGIAISETGRLCAVSSGKAMRFATAQIAQDYLSNQSTPGLYRFEIVRCSAASAGVGQPHATPANT